MFTDSNGLGRTIGILTSYAGILSACSALGPDATSAALESDPSATTESSRQALRAGSGLTLTGNSTLTPLAAGDGYGHNFDGAFYLANNTGKSVVVNKQLFFFAAPGGYAYGSPSHDIWWPSLTSSSVPVEAGTFGWTWSAPIAHLVARVDGTTSAGTSVAVLAGIPVIASGRTSPGASPYTDDIDIGVQAPIEILNLTSGERWLPVTGTVIDTTQTATSAPSLSISARNSSGSSVATLSQAFGPEDVPIRTFIAWQALAANVNVATLRITASQAIAGGQASQTRNIPVVTATPLAITSPVSGTWMWSNGPGEQVWQTHTSAPEGRYAYDLGIHRLVDGQLQSYYGDPGVNSSYFCWDQPIRAALTGTVRRVVSNLPDNNGNQGDNNQGNNEVVIEHANGIFTRYAHMRQNSATVSVGQVVYAGSVIALVGNAGASSEPHLHFHAFKIDATGRQVAVPVSVAGMKSTSGTALTGIPKGGMMYQSP